MTAGVADLIGDTILFRGFQRRAELLRTVRDYDAFGPNVDPHGERDFGRFEFAGETLYWKIDYYDRALTYGSTDPTDPDVTTRRSEEKTTELQSLISRSYAVFSWKK